VVFLIFVVHALRYSDSDVDYRSSILMSLLKLMIRVKYTTSVVVLFTLSIVMSNSM